MSADAITVSDELAFAALAKADRIAEYEGQRSEWDARVAALPAPLRERVDGFRVRGGDAWRWSSEAYEMACCEEAAKLATHFGNVDEIVAFSKMDYDQQKRAYPQMDSGHSGNTWGMSLRLAQLMHHDASLVPKDHAAFCALAGCEDSACWSTTQREDAP